MRVRWLVASVLVSVGALGMGSATAAADPVSGTVAMYSDPGDYIGQNQQQLLAGSADVTGSAGDVTISLSGTSWSMRFAAPAGQTLQPGVYDNAARAAFRAAGQPGIDIYGAGRGCNNDFGRFEIKDIALDSNGLPSRLWLIYEQHCEDGQPALFGEVAPGRTRERRSEPGGLARAVAGQRLRHPGNRCPGSLPRRRARVREQRLARRSGSV